MTLQCLSPENIDVYIAFSIFQRHAHATNLTAGGVETLGAILGNLVCLFFLARVAAAQVYVFTFFFG